MNSNNILTMNDLSVNDIMKILHDAMLFSNSQKDWQLSKSRLVANLFFEPSTRTHYAFLSAQHQLGCKAVNFMEETSSVKKGESLYDTVKTFEMLGYEAVVIRHPQDQYFQQLQGVHIPIINAGDGCGNHPSQCLLDLLTIYQEFQTFQNINLFIVGDIKHSRVAHSLIETLQRLGGNVRLGGPKEWVDQEELYMDIDQGVAWADAVMMLRIQRERHTTITHQKKEDYLQMYGLTQERVQKMKPHAIILHPAPVNRGVEIEDCLVEHEKSRIFKQMENGVLIRKSLFKKIFQEEF